MGAFLPLILPLIAPLIQVAEAAFTAPKAGQTKMAAVLQALRGFLAPLQAVLNPPTPGAPPPPAPTDDALQGVIETIFQQLKAAGQLTPPPPPGALYLVQGTVTPLKTM